MNTKLFGGLLIILITCKLIIDLFGVDYYTEKTHRISHFSFKRNYLPTLNVDDFEISRTAKYYLLGKGFLTDIAFDKPDFRKEGFSVSALRPKYQVLIFAAAIKLYLIFNPSYVLKEEGNMPDDFYQAFSLFMLAVKNILLIISIPFFLKMAKVFLKDVWAKITSLAYISYPNIFFFTGYYNLFDCMIPSLLVMATSIMIVGYSRGNSFSMFQSLAAGIFLGLTLVKSQPVLFIAVLFGLLLLLSIHRRFFNAAKFTIISGSIIILIILPVFYLNYKDFRTLVLTTQSGVSFFEGHNPYARGGWDANYWRKYTGYADTLLAPYADRLSQGEIEESKVYKELAIKWIKENPAGELRLIMKKTALLFFPHNFLNWKINIITLMIHLGFFGSIILFFVHYKSADKAMWLIYANIFSIWLLSIIFYVEYRWRIYAEPFIVLSAIIFFKNVYNYFRSRNKKAPATSLT